MAAGGGSATVEFRLLGRVEARLAGEPIDLGYAQLRSVLALLLVEANHVVAADRLIDRVWSDRRLPRRPRGALQHSVALLRAALAPVPGFSITWRHPGYQLTTDPGTVDLHRFDRLLADARTAGDSPRAAALLDEALRLWHGEPFAGSDVPWLAEFRATLVQRRRAAELDLADIRLRQGKHAELLPGLAERARDEPLDERLAGQLMLALYRTGRAADALEHYRRVRERLAGELGTDPGPALRRLHQRILTTDPALAVGRSPAVPVPRQLPAAPRSFTGRAAELADVTATLTEPGSAGVPLVVVNGPGGIGKTWLALHWAHEHAASFPDGQLYVNLRGFDPGGEPVPPATALRGFLDALGVAAEATPPEWEAQLGLYRSVLAGKRMLIVLDNARTTGQVVPLLPGSPACVVLVTSRHRLDGLVTAHGARSLALDVLTGAEARQLLTGHLGRHGVTADPGAVAELLGHCAGLPLAIGIVAARAGRHPGFPLAALAAELRDETGRLAALDTADADVNLRAVLSWSYHALSGEAAAAFGLLGLAAGPDIGVPAAACLLAKPAAGTLGLLRELEQASLVQQHVPGRFRMHDLIRLDAAQRAEADLPAAVRTAALRRLTDFYLHTAHAGDRLLQPLLPPIRLGEPHPGCQVLALADQPSALAWFAAEQHNLLAVQRLAAAQGRPVVRWQLAWLQTTFLYRQGRFEAALAAWKSGQEAANELDDPAVHTGTHQLLGAIFAELGRHAEARRHLALAERSGDLAGQAYTHHALGWSWSLRGADDRALEHAGEALRLYRALGMPAGVTRELTVSGWYLARLGDFTEARVNTEAALESARRHGYREDEGLATGILGFITQHTGPPRHALALYRDAVALLREVGNTYYEGTVLDFTGATHLALGETECARRSWQRALELYRVQQRTADADRVRRHLAGLEPRDLRLVVGRPTG
ncbi:BTAD domain-containing putative transcriptional regulator [Amycolatopsis sp. NPDC021455]|uniref:AfsR/SARP family transcriptional regulator n=1 Tax=Amycolatopsis sp. NPDC021455 TaxID=3154901 RepID=UPI00340D2596